MKKLLLFFVVLFSFTIKASAASSCSYQEQTTLNSKAANIKVSYDVVDKTVQFEDMDVTMNIFEITILNLTEDFYLIDKNNINEDTQTFTSSSVVDNVIKFKWENVEEVTNFTFQIYTSDNSSCPNEKIKTIYLTTPRYNDFSSREVCQNLEDFYLCEKFVTFDEVTESEFLNKLDSYREEEKNIEPEENQKEKEENKSTSDNVFEFIDNYKWVAVGTLVLILVILIIIKNKKQKKQRDLGL